MREAALITGGGTGGHVYPALSIMRSLRSRLEAGAEGRSFGSIRPDNGAGEGGAGASDTLVYVGSTRGMERTLVPPTGVASHFLPMAPPTSPRGVMLLTIAALRCIPLMVRRPRVTVATGGYVCVPASLASWLLRIPIVLFVPDVTPAKAIRALIPLARRIAATTEDSLEYLPRKKTVVTGYPVRPAFARADRVSARGRFGIPQDATVLCVFGGSLGARSINDAVGRSLSGILSRDHVIHICGRDRLPEAEALSAGLAPAERARYHLFAYLDEEDMASALASADLVLSRSGASVLGELPAAGVPAVLVPLPLSGPIQRRNACFLADKGAAVILDNDDLDRNLDRLLRELLGDRARLQEMAANCRALFLPDAGERIADLVLETVS